MPGFVLKGPRSRGGQPDLDIRPTPGSPGNPNPDHHPTQPRVRKRSQVRVGGTGFTGGTIKLGLRLHQDDHIEQFTVATSRGQQLQLASAPQHEVELERALGRAADERWVGYEVQWTGVLGQNFDTELILDRHRIPENGFRVVTVAFTHTNKSFEREDYIYGVSVIPGRHSRGFRIALGPGAPRRARPAPGKTARRRAPAKPGGRRKR